MKHSERTYWHKEAIELRNKGYKLQQIGNRFGVSRERVRQVCNDMKWKLYADLTYSWKEEAITMRSTHTVDEIAKKFNKSRNYIYQITRNNKITKEYRDKIANIK